MQDNDKKKLRELILKAKTYRALAMVFAVMGVVVFAVLFSQHNGGDITEALKDPLIIAFIVFPFLPSILLSFKAKKAENEMRKLLPPK